MLRCTYGLQYGSLLMGGTWHAYVVCGIVGWSASRSQAREMLSRVSIAMISLANLLYMINRLMRCLIICPIRFWSFVRDHLLCNQHIVRFIQSFVRFRPFLIIRLIQCLINHSIPFWSFVRFSLIIYFTPLYHLFNHSFYHSFDSISFLWVRSIVRYSCMRRDCF